MSLVAHALRAEGFDGSEAACAQMREALRGVVDNEKCDTDGGHNSVGCFACASYIMAIEAAERALATDAGRGYVSTEGAVESHCYIYGNYHTTTGPTAVRCPAPADWAGREVYIILKEDKP